MNNNDHFNQYISSFHYGSELSFPLPMGLEHEELAFNSYYSPKHNNAVDNSNQNLYRPYDNDSSNNNDGVNGGGLVHSAGSLGNRNVLGNSTNASANSNEKTSAGPHFPDTSYYNYPHFQNANFWPQFFQHNNNVSEPNAQDLRNPPPPSDPMSFCLSEDDSNGSVHEIDVERSPLTSPDVIQTSSSPTMFPSDLFLSQQNYQQPFAPVSNDTHKKHPLPIRPIPQQASVVSPTQNVPFMCSECGRYCFSSGGLKRHLDVCHIVRAKLEKVTAKLVVDAESPYHSPNSTVDTRPLNLSSDKTRAVTKQAATDVLPFQCEPMNFTLNNVFAGVPLLSEENNNCIQSQSTSAIPTISKITMPTIALTVLPILGEQDPLVSPIVSDCLVKRRDRKCPQCPLILHSEKALIKHLVSHNIHQPFECTTCGSRFSRKFHLTRHMKQRGCDGTPQIQFECEFCGKHFSRKDNMREHVKGHMGQNRKKKKLPCPFPMCEKKLSGKTQLQAHLNFHSDSRPYNCTHADCDKNFRSNAALKKHLHIHNNHVKDFQCPQCDAFFGTKNCLDRHVKRHDLKRSVKSYICHHCDMAFIHQTHLKDHIKEHIPAETFECEICHRTYKRHWRLQKHYKQTHHGNLGDESNSTDADSTLPVLPNVEENEVTYPHACDRCPRKFDKRQELKFHYVTHFQGTLLECTECSCVYTRRDCLLRHLRTKHRLLPNEALESMKKVNPRTLPDEPVASLATDVEFADLSTTSKANEPQDSTSGEIIDVGILEGNIIELLSLLVDPEVMSSFGWPNYSVDRILQSVLVKCGKEPLTQPNISLAQRLRGNTQSLFSFLVDDQTALRNLFSRRPVEQVLEQVIELARNAGDSTNVLLPL